MVSRTIVVNIKKGEKIVIPSKNLTIGLPNSHKGKSSIIYIKEELEKEEDRKPDFFKIEKDAYEPKN